MKIVAAPESITAVQADAVVVNLFQGVQSPGGATGAVDRTTGGLITRLLQSGEFEGKLGETALLHFPPGLPQRKLVLVGLGPASDFSLERVREVSAAALKEAARGGARRVATIVHGAGIGGLDPRAAARALAEGSVLAAYKYLAFKSDAGDVKGAHRVEELVVAETDPAKLPAIEAGIREGSIVADSVNFARDLVNAPSNHMTPGALAEAARRTAQETGLECKVLERDEMERLGMGALLGVAKGSAEAPKLIVLRYARAASKPLVALVGKGVTFDTGGISLKPAQGMGEMKGDMAGAAAVLGTIRALALLEAEANVLAIVPAVENMPSGTAMKPGDVVRAMNGKTIEVDNTDAEGRLILADAVSYAASLGATRIVDVATLTGACIVALGRIYTGVVGTDDRLVEELLEAARAAGEKFWRLPSDPAYKELYKSDVADVRNTGGREGGAITGALFISEFAAEAGWAHLDIAGTSFADKEKAYTPKGGTGVAVRTLVEWLSR